MKPNLSDRPLRKGLFVVLVAFLVGGCSGGVGDGETIERIDILTTDGAVRSFHCFYSSLTAIATFEGGGREDVTNRGTWSSSNSAAVRISNGDLVTPSGLRVGRGIIAPIGTPGVGVARVSFEFVGLGDSALVNIEEASLEITPATFRLAEGTGVNFVANGRLGDPAMDDFSLFFANFATNWSLSDDTVGEITNPSRTAGGGSFTSEDIAADTTVTVTANTDMDGCLPSAGNPTPGEATASLEVLDEDFERLEFRNLFIARPRANNVAPVTTMAQGTDQLYRVLAIDDDQGFVQDVTSRILGRQGTDETMDEGLFSSDDEVLTPLRGVFSALPVDATDTADVTARLDQLGTSVETAAPTTFTVTPATLTGITISPATQNAAPATSVQYTAEGTFDMAPGTQDISASVIWQSGDATNAPVAPGGTAIVSETADDTTDITVDASRTDNPSLDADLQTSIDTADTGDTAFLDIVSIPVDTVAETLTIDLFPDNQQPRDTTCPDVGADGDVSNDTIIGSRCALRARADANGQDVTTVVIWTSSDTSVLQVGNASPLIGELYPLAAGTTTVTARLFNTDQELVAFGSTTITVP